MKKLKILFIDNFDSFTYNLVDEFKKEGCEIKIYRNDINMIQLDKILSEYGPGLIVLSPGPSHPKDAGICIPLIRKYYKDFPMLGICLGHQCMIEALGGIVSAAKILVHGKKSEIKHTGPKIFFGLPNPFYAGRYHSLYGSKIPAEFEITATSDGMPMAIQSKKHSLFGLQFHPESILTAQGSIIIKNILEAVK